MKVIDISSKLTNEKPIIKIAEGMEFPVKNDKNTVLTVNQLFSADGNDVENFDKILKVLLGEKAVKAIDKLELPYQDYVTIIKGVTAAATGQEIEEVEQRFQQ